jgi:hypothetical protein
MYQSLILWIQQTFSQTDPLASRNELSPTEIDQILANCRVKGYSEALAMANSTDTSYSVDSTTARVTITLHDLTTTRREYAHDHNYWYYPDNFEVLVNDVVIDDHLYTYYPVSMDLVFTAAQPVNAVVKLRGHILRRGDTMRKVASQWLLKIGLLANVKADEFDRIEARFTRVVNRAFGAHKVRRG